MHSSKQGDCERIKSELSAYIDRELNKKVMNRVEEHLKTCSICREEYHTLLNVKKMIKGIKRVEVDSYLPLKIIDRVTEIKPLPEMVWFPVTIRVAVLIAIIINISIFSLFRDYRFMISPIPSYRPIKIEKIMLTEERESITVSFSIPFRDSIDEYTPPEVVSIKTPSYSEKLLSRNIEGTVILNIVVDETGDTKSVRVTKSLSSEADSLSFASAKTMKFNPAKIGTVKVKGFITASFLFKI